MSSVHRSLLTGMLAGATALAALASSGCAQASTPGPAVPGLTVEGEALEGATVPSGSVVRADLPGAVSVKFLLDGAYLGVDRTAPFTWPLAAPGGEHRLKVRATDGSGAEIRAEASFRIGTATSTSPEPGGTGSGETGSSGTGSGGTGSGGTGSGGTGTGPASTSLRSTGPAEPGALVPVSTVAELQEALATATPGSVIELADGVYTSRSRLVAGADGREGAPITLRGTRAAVLSSTGPKGDYGLHVTGDHWRVEGITVANASKGVVLDQSVGTVLDGIEVHTIGDEGVHFRWCSRNGVLRNSLIRDTGLRAPRFGEGVYVGSASSNWSKYSCEDGRDNSENVLVEDNVFRDIAAEGADLKEGTESGVLRGNVFENVGYSGENSADSAVDAKGNGWLVEGNVVRRSGGAFLDAFQTHTVASGYGTGNVFRANRVEGEVPGFGFGLYPRSGNVVTCDNVAPGAAKGLVGDGSRPSTCG